MKTKLLWSTAIILFIGVQVGVGVGYHSISNWMDNSEVYDGL